MPILFETQRHEKIINYISLHQGCSKEEACDALTPLLSRNTFFKDLPKLVAEGKIIVKQVNKRDTRLFVDRDNPLIYVPKQLDDFDDAYTKLLYESKRRIKEKDFSEVTQFLGIAEINPAKWSIYDVNKFNQYQLKIANEWVEYNRKIYHELDMLNNEIESLRKIVAEWPKRSSNILTVQQKRILGHAYSKVKYTKKLLKEREQVGIQKRSSFEVVILMTNSVRIHFTLIEIVTNLGIAVWPKVIRDKEGLNKLNTYVFSKISELQFKLSSFIAFFSISDPIEYLIDAKQRFSNKGLLTGIMEDYRALGMKSEIESVTSILSRITGNLTRFGYSGGVDKNEEAFSKIMDSTSTFEKEFKLVNLK